MKRAIKGYGANGIALAIFIVLSGLDLFSDKIFSKVGSSKYYLISLINIVIFLIPIIYIGVKSKSTTKNILKLKILKLKWIPVTFFAALSVCLFSIFLNSIVIKALNLTSGNFPSNPLSNINWDEPFSVLLAIIIVPAIMEELFFRGAFLSSFSENNKLAAMFCGAFCFAFLHSTPYNFFGPLLAGIAYGLLTIIFNSIYPAIFAHIVNNTVSCAIWYYSDKISAGGLETAAIISGIIMLLVFIYLTLKLIEPFLNKIKGKPKLHLSQRREKQKNTAKVYTVSFFILFSLWLAKIIAIIVQVWG